MIAIQLVAAVLSAALDQLLQTRYGLLGVISLLLVGAGIRARNSTYASIGAIMLVLLMTQA
ncbi:MULTISPECIES: hypothetical protein [unclassified Streptomyces]|jgi:hypothetical protein|uniref:hypothetical protein n=1 Tax=unclassified Streptomyces TaxID=2593676 RepID=UPI00114D6E33|nr:hypothetical protein [Streptomyces sp. SLBN-31]TQJ74913.1 hypothetical protein FBY22_7926 [Streptomyces sp. SLBN-31]